MTTSEAVFRASILPFTLHEEGGYSKDRNDPGNWTGGKIGAGVFKGTMYGIAANSHPNLDIKNLTLAQAGDIYWNEYMPSWCRDLHPALCLVIFDCNVNCGSGKGRKILTIALKAPTLLDQIKTATAANLSYHRSLKTWGRYGTVWGGRIARCQAVALKILAGEKSYLPQPSGASVVPPVPKPKHTDPLGSSQEPQDGKGGSPATMVAEGSPKGTPEAPVKVEVPTVVIPSPPIVHPAPSAASPTLGEVLWGYLKAKLHGS